MFADGKVRLISYHDTWISVDPVQGCPYACVYCVLRHAGHTGVSPEQAISPRECVRELLEYPLFVRGRTPLAIGNETDMFHARNVDYLIELLEEMGSVGLENPIVLVTKAPLLEGKMQQIRAIAGLRLILFLSYSGLDRRFEPNFTDRQLRENFSVAKRHGFSVVHYWRPLLPGENTKLDAICEMLKFVSSIADATVFAGLKLHPELTRVITNDGSVSVPEPLLPKTGEWLDSEAIATIYQQAARIRPAYPLYRHASCALAAVLGRPNHTATVYRKDICPPSHCSVAQRKICEGARRIPPEVEIAETLATLGRKLKFERHSGRVVVKGEITQEEFAFLLHNLNCPLEVEGVRMQNLYHGSIYEGQKKVD